MVKLVYLVKVDQGNPLLLDVLEFDRKHFPLSNKFFLVICVAPHRVIRPPPDNLVLLVKSSKLVNRAVNTMPLPDLFHSLSDGQVS